MILSAAESSFERPDCGVCDEKNIFIDNDIDIFVN